MRAGDPCRLVMAAAEETTIEHVDFESVIRGHHV